MEAREFKPLKDIGAIALSDTSELRFYVDEFKGHRFGSIRTFITGGTYSGPTKAGVTFNAASLEGVVQALAKLPAESPGDAELARFTRRVGVELVVRVIHYKEAAGLDLREWVDDAEYKGWSKKGVRIPYSKVAEVLAFLRAMQPHVVKT